MNGQRSIDDFTGLDIYIWLTVKQFWLEMNNRDSYPFTWDMIAQNFSTRDLETAVAKRNFRNEIKKAVHDIQAVWPDCGIDVDLNGVTVTKTAPSIRKKPPRLRLD